MRPFQFIVAAPHQASGARELTDAARRAEDLGCHSIVLADHLLGQHAPIPALATIAAATQTLRVGAFVFNNSLRHPAVLAQDLATLDVLSGGRLDIGIGAGWNRPEYLSIGLPFPPPRVRVAQLAEAIAVMKGAFAPGPFSFAGKHYTLVDFDGAPAPAQRPHPPFFIGGGGKRVLTLAGREADRVGLAPRIDIVDGRPVANAASLTAGALVEKICWVREAAGARFDALDLNAYPSGAPLTITDDPRGAAQRLADRIGANTGVRLSVDEILDSPHVYLGTVDMLVDKLIGMRERFGVNSYMLGEVATCAPIVERLAGT